MHGLYGFGKKLIDDFRENYSVIVSGRDLMKIYPPLDYHIFITASLEERVRRKCIQYKESGFNKEEVEANIRKRDELQENSGFYEIYSNTVVIDVTKDSSAKKSADRILEKIELPYNT